MAFSLFGHRDRLSPLWSFAPGGLLWRLLPTASGGFVGESRDPEGLRVSFFHLDAATGSVLWKDRSWAEPWWTGLEAVHGSLAILHEYVKPDMPDHGRIHVVDLATGDLVWSAPDVAFAAISGDRLLATRLDSMDREQVILDLRTGERLGVRDRSAEVDAWSLESDAAHATSAGLQFPEQVPVRGGDPNGESMVEEIRGGNWSVKGTYEPVAAAGPPTMRQRLQVADAVDRILLDQIIHAEARAVVPDTFFVWNGILYYLKEQRTLVAVRLP